MDIQGTFVMSAQRRSWLWLWLSLSVLVGVIASEAFRIASYDTDIPVVFQRVEVLNSPLIAGETLLVRIWREKIRDDCPVYSHRHAINSDGVSYYVGDALWPGGPAQTTHIDYAYPTVATMPPGNYEMRVHLVYNCPGFQYEVDQPSAPFRIITRN